MLATYEWLTWIGSIPGGHLHKQSDGRYAQMVVRSSLPVVGQNVPPPDPRKLKVVDIGSHVVVVEPVVDGG
jgi:hypothetical protein